METLLRSVGSGCFTPFSSRFAWHSEQVKRPWGEDKNRPISTHHDRCGRLSFKEGEGEQDERKRRRMRIRKNEENREKSGNDRYFIGLAYLSII
jgi:hypothetical protein